LEAEVTVRKVLFLCTGNSCRSQMAEAIVNARYPNWRAFSAGARPAGFVHPLAIEALAEIGIAHEGESKSVEKFRNDRFDFVVTLCDAASEECPVWLGRGIRLHESFEDPASTVGTDQDRLAVFRKVRDEMLLRIPDLLKKPA
jgi:arsenate reductase